MDTQGLFEPLDSESDYRIFGLSTLISSVQIFNMKNTIGEDALEYLELTTAFTRLLSAKINKTGSNSFKAFQSLMFLIRDFNDESYPFGYEGGRKKLDETLSIKKNATNFASLSVRKNIDKAFDNITCFLMPEPGPKVK